jgi:hypothetical protein
MRRTDAGLTLELLLSKLPNRWLFCWSGERGEYAPYDCACCMTWPSEEMYHDCGCICHRRIEKMAADPDIRLWLLASMAMDEFPFIASSLEEELRHQRKNAALHKSWERKLPCECSDCKAAHEQDMTVGKHELEKDEPCDCFYCTAVRKVDAEIAEAAEVE